MTADGPVVLVINPTSRGAGRAERLLRQATAQRGLDEPTVLHTTAVGMGAPEARRALEAGARLVVAGGGDGTVRAVAQEMRGSGTPLAVLPLGTANIFARNLGLSPSRLPRAVAAALDQHPVPVDLGIASFRTPEAGQWSPEHVFFVLAGLGHDADTVAGVDPRLKGRVGWLAYFVAGVRQLLGRPLVFTVSRDGSRPETRRVWSLLVGNAGRIPTGLELFPGARLDDGLLRTIEVCVERPWQWARVAAEGLLRWKAVSPPLVHGVARRLELVPAEPCALQLDGDVFGPVTAARFRVEPDALLVVRPPRRRLVPARQGRQRGGNAGGRSPDDATRPAAEQHDRPEQDQPIIEETP